MQIPGKRCPAGKRIVSSSVEGSTLVRCSDSSNVGDSWTRGRTGLFLLMFWLLASPSWANGKTARAMQTEHSPRIDGVIDPVEWQDATRLDEFIQFEPFNGTPATQPTLVYLLYNNTHIFIGVHAHDDDPAQITARLTRRDDDLKNDDSIWIFLDTFFDHRTCYFFAVNPLGTQLDGRIRDNGRVEDKTWDTAWASAAKIHSDGWTAEFAVPLRSITFRKGKDQSWGLNVGRTRRTNLETSMWTGPLENLFRVSQYGELQGLTLEGGGARPWTMIPYALARYGQEDGWGGDAGFDVRYSLRPETIFNATVNPDFAIIEADEEFINLTRFEPALPEKRPFFLETNDRFQQRIRTFYSRRIGDIEAGGKFFSNQGKWDSTALTVLSAPVPVPQGTPENPQQRANFTVARTEREVMKSSTLGFMVSNRYLAGDNYGSISMDSTMFFGQALRFTGQLIRSHGLFDRGNWAYFARLARDTSTSHVHFRYTSLGENLGDNINAVGFIPDDNRKEMDADLSKIIWLDSSPFQRLQFATKNNVYWSQTNVLRSYHNTADLSAELRNRWVVGGGFRNDYKLFEKGFHNDYGHVFFGYNTREFNSFDVAYQKGRNFDSDFQFVNLRCSRKLTQKLGIEYRLRRVWLDPDPEQRATTIHVVNALQNFTRDLFLKVFFQTNSVIDRKHLEVVFVWRYKPPFGSLQFAFQRGRAEFGQASTQGNTYFVKFAYVL